MPFASMVWMRPLLRIRSSDGEVRLPAGLVAASAGPVAAMLPAAATLAAAPVIAPAVAGLNQVAASRPGGSTVRPWRS